MSKEVVDYNVVAASFLSPVTKKRKYREYFALLDKRNKRYH